MCFKPVNDNNFNISKPVWLAPKHKSHRK